MIFLIFQEEWRTVIMDLHFAKQQNLNAGGSKQHNLNVGRFKTTKPWMLEGNWRTQKSYWSNENVSDYYWLVTIRFNPLNHSTLKTQTNTHTNNNSFHFYIVYIKLISTFPFFSRPTQNFLLTYKNSEPPLLTSKNTLTSNLKNKIEYVSPIETFFQV